MARKSASVAAFTPKPITNHTIAFSESDYSRLQKLFYFVLALEDIHAHGGGDTTIDWNTIESLVSPAATVFGSLIDDLKARFEKQGVQV